jgi:hypothetical protein
MNEVIHKSIDLVMNNYSALIDSQGEINAHLNSIPFRALHCHNFVMDSNLHSNSTTGAPNSFRNVLKKERQSHLVPSMLLNLT